LIQIFFFCGIDPNLIPQFVDVVIGDYLYSFQFKLEDGGEDDEPQPLDMDSFWDEQHDEHMEEGQGKTGHSIPSHGK
jgi:hypothetical protein